MFSSDPENLVKYSDTFQGEPEKLANYSRLQFLMSKRLVEVVN